MVYVFVSERTVTLESKHICNKVLKGWYTTTWWHKLDIQASKTVTVNKCDIKSSFTTQLTVMKKNQQSNNPLTAVAILLNMKLLVQTLASWDNIWRNSVEPNMVFNVVVTSNSHFFGTCDSKAPINWKICGILCVENIWLDKNRCNAIINMYMSYIHIC